jgi:hypothetical protein
VAVTVAENRAAHRGGSANSMVETPSKSGYSGLLSGRRVFKKRLIETALINGPPVCLDSGGPRFWGAHRERHFFPGRVGGPGGVGNPKLGAERPIGGGEATEKRESKLKAGGPNTRFDFPGKGPIEVMP